MMITFKNQAAQGDMLMTRIDRLPDGVKEMKAENGVFILAHSETGHNHVVKAQPGIRYYANDNDPFTAYLVVDNAPEQCFVEHLRGWDTHHPISFSDGVYKIKRQREYTPEGFRRVAD